MAEQVFLAVDMGASSGRHVAGRFDGARLRLEEIYRFENGGIDLAGRFYWDLPAQWNHVRQGLRVAGAKLGREVTSVGVDTWGVDFALLGRGDEILGNPYHYRDGRTNGMMEHAYTIVPREEIFRHTGLQFMQFNTLFQLLAMKVAHSPILEAAESLLMVPDVFHWLLTGVKCNEMTEASTSQFYNPVKGGWATELLERFGLPTSILGDIHQPGTDLGPLRANLVDDTRLSAHVVLPGSHDTASAVMAVPAASRPGQQPDWCYISLGTWALMGIESPRPVINNQVLSLNFTNEGGVGNTIRLLKNIAGLWTLQESRRQWRREGQEYSWGDLTAQAEQAEPFRSIIDPDAVDFLNPSNMVDAIRGYCRNTGQPVPETVAQVVRCCLESLALRYRWVFNALEEITGTQIETMRIVGGGSQNRLLSQLAADSCRRPVITGPVEATALGNVMLQAIATGHLSSVAEGREAIAASIEQETFEPGPAAGWDEAFARYEALAARG